MNIYQSGTEKALLLLQLVTTDQEKKYFFFLCSTESKHGKVYLERGKSGSAFDLPTYQKFLLFECQIKHFSKENSPCA